MLVVRLPDSQHAVADYGRAKTLASDHGGQKLVFHAFIARKTTADSATVTASERRIPSRFEKTTNTL